MASHTSKPMHLTLTVCFHSCGKPEPHTSGAASDAAFKGWAAGEVLFEGVSARKQDSRFATPWSVTYSFRVQENAVLDIGPATGIEKNGWDLLDIRYEIQAASDALVRVPIGAYVHQVYETADFSALGIGT